MLNIISGVNFSVFHGLAPVIVPVNDSYHDVASDKPLARIGPTHTLGIVTSCAGYWKRAPYLEGQYWSGVDILTLVHGHLKASPPLTGRGNGSHANLWR